MKTPFRLLVLGLIMTVFFAILGTTPSAQAQVVLSDSQLQLISTNCQAIKNTLSQLRASDTLLRVNRGQVYEAVGAKLMNNFNSRLSNNGLDNKGLQLVSGNYQTALTNFRSDYSAYEKQLSAAIRIDCEKQPSEFHFAVADAREKRVKAHEDVIKLHQYLDDYRAAANDFLLNFERVTGNN